jgi:hypothetical protein
VSVTNSAVSLAARRYLSPKEVAANIPGMTVAKLSQLRFKGEGPRFFKPTAKTVLYAESDLVDWIESTVRTGTSEANYA